MTPVSAQEELEMFQSADVQAQLNQEKRIELTQHGVNEAAELP